MLIHWCHKGIAANAAFGDAEALAAHVNVYSTGGVDSPYISLAAGCYEYRGGATPAIHRSGIAQAARFATRGGKTDGYLFKLCVVTSPKPAAELPGFAEEVRDLNLFHGFHRWHNQGEITAKLVIPRRQILSVVKLDPTGQPMAWAHSGSVHAIANSDFMPPDRISNVIEAI